MNINVCLRLFFNLSSDFLLQNIYSRSMAFSLHYYEEFLILCKAYFNLYDALLHKGYQYELQMVVYYRCLFLKVLLYLWKNIGVLNFAHLLETFFPLKPQINFLWVSF